VAGGEALAEPQDVAGEALAEPQDVAGEAEAVEADVPAVEAAESPAAESE
jgi:hypothetical protein